MNSRFKVIENEITDDSHIVFNLSILKSLVEIGRLESFVCSDSLLKLYSNVYPEISNYRNDTKINSVSNNYLFLTGSWNVLIKCLFIRGNKTVIFHNFYRFLESKSLKNRIKSISYQVLIRLGHLKPVVLNVFIKNWITERLNVSHDVLQIFYDDNIVKSFITMKIDAVPGKVMFGNLFPGKVDEVLLKRIRPVHYGKLHGGMVYSDSINRYLTLSEYYSLFNSVDSIVILNKNNHRVASGVIADAVSLGKLIVCASDEFLIDLVKRFPVDYRVEDNIITIDTTGLKSLLRKEFNQNLKKL